MSDALPLAGRTGCVVGAASGAGRAIAIALAEAGADLALATTTRETAEVFAVHSAANELWALGRRQFVLEIDAREPPSAAAALARALAELGPIDLLVNAVSAVDAARPLVELTDGGWQETLDRRLSLVFRTCHAAGQAMLAGAGGSIVNVVSTVAEGRARAAAEAAAQAGVVALSRSLALEWQDHIAVHAIIADDAATPERVAALVVWLARAGAAELGGQVLRI